jgi:hypothetical protein
MCIDVNALASGLCAPHFDGAQCDTLSLLFVIEELVTAIYFFWLDQIRLHLRVLTFFADPYKIEVADMTANYSDFINQFDAVYIANDEYIPSSVVSIKIFQDDNLIKSALLGASGGHTGVHETSAVLDGNKLAGCCANTVYSVSIPELDLLWRTEADLATCFQIFKHQQDYIIHGELEISRIDKNGKIVWQHSGADIFVNLDGQDEFIMTYDYILATDFENRKYKFDFDGNIID